MIITKVISQRAVQLAVANQPVGQISITVLATKNHKQYTNLTRTLVQSTSQNQKVTNTNNQQHLIPISRNISFRQCGLNDRSATSKSNAHLSFSVSAGSPTSHFISADLDQSILTGNQEVEERESPFDALKRKAKDVVEKRETIAKSKYYGQSFNEAHATEEERKLVVLMTWLAGKEKHIEKYRQFYLDRGYDVLNVKTSPANLLLPSIGAKKVSQDFVRFMKEKQYSNVVLHGFSVGGFMFGQVLLDIDQQEEKVRQQLLNSFKGIIFDSLVPFEGTCIGVARSITENKLAAKVLENLLRLYLFLGYSISTKHYLKVSDKVWAGPLRCPTLFLMSRDDVISDHSIVERLESDWKNLGVETFKKIYDSSPHVQHFQKHHKDYVERVESFLKHLKIN